MKALHYRRHSDKGTGENSQLIMEPGLNLASKNVKQDWYTDLFHGMLVRTAQTLLADISTNGVTAKVHPPVREMGDGDLFAHWVKDLSVPFGKDGRTNLEAVKEGLGEQYLPARETAAQGVESMFAVMEKNGVGLAYGHSPIIEMAMEHFGFDTSNHFALASLEGAVFHQADDGTITVADVIRI